MSTLDKHASVPVELALQLEGAALNAGLTTAEFLEELLSGEREGKKRNLDTDQIREIIRKRQAKGVSDTEIAKEVGVSQQAVSRLRSQMGLKSGYRRSRKVC